MLFDNEKVLNFLPHRDPFLFIDSVESIECRDWELGKVVETKDIVGCKVVANFHAKEELEIFKGHFPGKPILPGVIQVEMMAQASSFVVAALVEDPFKVTEMDVALASVSNAKFRRPVLPGMDLKIKAVCTRYRGVIMSCDCEIYSNDELMSQASVLASIRF